MGWWRCNEHGGIEWPVAREGLANALPGEDNALENFYNGDAPADAMYVPISILKSWFKHTEPKPNQAQLVKLFTEKVSDDVFGHIDEGELFGLVDLTWKEIDAIYMRAWKRPAFPEEKVYICLFSFGGADGWEDRYTWNEDSKKKRKNEWWEIKDHDEKCIKNLKENEWPYWWRNP